MGLPLDPTFPPSEATQHLERAYALEARDALAEALRACDAALALAPGWAEAHNLRGIVLDALGRRAEAVRSFRRAVQLDPETADWRENLEGAEQDLETDLVAGPAHEEAGPAAAGPDQFVSWPTPLAPGEDLVTIATYWFPLQAYIAQGRLECDGIWSTVADDITIQVNWLYCLAIGGVKLKVKETDAAAAMHALEPLPVNQLWLEEQAGPDDPRCPDCGSLDVHLERLSIRGVFLTWVLAGPALLLIINALLYLFPPRGFFVFVLNGIPYSSTPSWSQLLASLLFLPVSVAALMAVGFPLPIFKNRWHCDNCGNEWREKDLEEVPQEDEMYAEEGSAPSP